MASLRRDRFASRPEIYETGDGTVLDHPNGNLEVAIKPVAAGVLLGPAREGLTDREDPMLADANVVATIAVGHA